MGLLGGVHCVGMCGAIVGALSLGLPPPVHQHPRQLAPFLLAYNAGRLFSYTLAGALLGGIGWLAGHLVAIHQLQGGLRILAGLFMVMLGLYLGGWWSGLAQVERAGATLWRRIEPLGRGLLPVRRLNQALALGLVWGWLPCGLVYSILIWAIASGSAGQGALFMLSFGLGTLPNLLVMGTLSGLVVAQVRKRRVRQAAGILVIGMGAWQLTLVTVDLIRR